MRIKYLIIPLIGIFLVAGGCKNRETKSFAIKADSLTNYQLVTELPKASAKDKKEPSSVDTLIVEEKCNVIERYGIPLSTQLLDTALLGPANFAQLYSPDSASRLIKSFNKAFYLGVYSADLVYSMIYDNRSLFYEYYYVVMRLSDDLGIKETFTMDMLEKFRENYRSDTVDVIIKNALVKTCRFLDENNQVSILPFMVVGSWAEATYLMIGNAIYNQDVSTEIYENIADQQQTLKKLKTFINDNLLGVDDYNISVALHKLNNDLDTVARAYDEIYVSDNIAIDKNSLLKLYGAFRKLKGEYM